MNILEWLDTNELRAYPLMEGTSFVSNLGYTLTNDVILDASLVYTIQNGEDNPQLVSIVNNGSSLVFNITGLSSFTIPIAGPFPYYSRNSSNSLLVVGLGGVNIPVGTHVFTNVKFEPSVNIELGPPWQGVSSITFNSSTPLTGAINCIEGYQFGVDIQSNVLSLGADKGLGIPIGCHSFGLGAGDCSEIISFINGVGPDDNHVLRIEATNGIILLESPGDNMIVIGLLNTNNTDCAAIQFNPLV